MYNRRSSFLGNIPPVVKNLMAINLILWLATGLLPGILKKWGINFDLIDIMGMHYWSSQKFNLTQLISYMFLHGGFGHLFFNMFALYMFGGVIENYWGSKRFLTYYFITGIGAGIVQQVFWTVEYQHIISALNDAIANNSAEVLLPLESTFRRYFNISGLAHISTPQLIDLKRMFLNLPVTIGASGSVFGLLLAFGWLFPEARLMMLFFPIPIKARVFVIIYGVAELFLGVANFSGDSVAHFAHLGGMLFGVFYILYIQKGGGRGTRNTMNNFKNKMENLYRGSKMKIRKNKSTAGRKMNDEEFNMYKAGKMQEIDRILDKIKSSGYSSLTAEEKQKLFDQGKND